ncbi:putative Ig domain-containing protein [Leucobacter sp. M11]|uniref:putative Ig domain-containing protein n=1 Tax=Leucobacter sp. M11 TaxID=2993565 RepID=UPI002D8094DD|nr:putative Ig domain-containing protein [Leucobacter sp. M11]MEB4615177.1 putative Ig domain-containing protein [Leucobacter sp. M11]
MKKQWKRCALAVVVGAALLVPVGAAHATEVTPRPADIDQEDRPKDVDDTLVSELVTTIDLGAGSMPTDVHFADDGVTAYAVTRVGGTFHAIDVASRTLTSTIDLRAGIAALPGGIDASDLHPDLFALSPDGTRAYVTVVPGSLGLDGVAVVDLSAGVVSAYHRINSFSGVTEMRATPDGTAYVLGDSSGDVWLMDAATGDQIAKHRLSKHNISGVEISSDGFEVLALSNGQGKDRQRFSRLGITDLAPVADHEIGNEWDVSYTMGLNRYGADTQLYFSGGVDGTVATLNQETGAYEQEPISVGSMLGDIEGDPGNDAWTGDEPGRNRAFVASQGWDMIMAADLAEGIRSESFRAVPDSPTQIDRDPVSGALISANTGWLDEEGSTVSIMPMPSAVVAGEGTCAAGDEVQLSATLTGISRGAGGGVNWEVSTDGGKTFEGIEGEYSNELVTADPGGATAAQYRLYWRDDFWGRYGTTEPVTSPCAEEHDGPQITRDELPGGTVGKGYGSVEITATGTAPLTWSVSTAGPGGAQTQTPPGLRLDPATGALTGIPTAPGTYVLTVTVTDAYGSDTKEFVLVVAEPAVVPGDGDADGSADAGADGDADAAADADADAAGSGDAEGTGSGSGSGSGAGTLPETGADGQAAALGLAALAALTGAGLLAARRRRGADA